MANETMKEVLMRRDNMSELEADNYLEETMDEIRAAIADGDLDEVEDIMLHDVGLEMDYLEDMMIGGLIW